VNKHIGVKHIVGWTNTSWLVGGRVQKSGLLNKHIVKNIVVGWWVGG